MKMDPNSLPVYKQKEKILETLNKHQVIIVQSPTGSGKTTQLPVILHEAGYSQTGIIAVTQPRRIAALSVSEFIANQLHTTYPGLVGYKMRFEDKTDSTTKIKIMTDGILLQEMKLDPWLSRYSVVMVDEAHERSLNIDFVLGLLKRILQARKDFKVIISSATMNVDAFSNYFDNCPIVTIDTITYPVALVYNPPLVPASTLSMSAIDALLQKITETVERVIYDKNSGDILIFLPGEKIIKDCMNALLHSPVGKKIYCIPLYGRLAKEEQERVFDSVPFGKKKVVISTNIAETSITIDGITTVIDSGLAKLNFYNPKSYTSSLIETPVSKASCNQRKGRAGRTQEGICYRLYPKKDFETRPLYTTEEIYRTDLSEVVLRMAELGITDFEQFDFISPPGKQGIRGAVETLTMLNALNEDNTLSNIGKLMVAFPLMPRQSRILVEAILHYPDVLEEALIATAFLSSQSPFILPPGQEIDARQAHHAFRHPYGDFVSYVKIFTTYTESKKQEVFCEKYFLDKRVLDEIVNIKEQLEQIISDMKIPIGHGGSLEDYLCCVAAGMIQFVCVRESKEMYKSLTAEHIQIHPGSNMFRHNPQFIVAGEIVKTSRMFAMSVSPLTKEILTKLNPNLEKALLKNTPLVSKKETKNTFKANEKKQKKLQQNKNSLQIGNIYFKVKKIKGKKHVDLPIQELNLALEQEKNESYLAQIAGLRGRLIIEKSFLLVGEKLNRIFTLIKTLNLIPLRDNQWNKSFNCNFYDTPDLLISNLDKILRITTAKKKSKELGFICLFTDGKGNYWFKVSRGFITALNESLSSLETLIDDAEENTTEEQKQMINNVYRMLHTLYE